MKKHIINLFLLGVLITGGVSSCSFLDIDQPDNLIKDDFWQTKEQVKSNLSGVYTSIHNNLPQLIKWGDLRSEIYNYGTADKLQNEIQFVKQDISTDNGLNNWSEVYKAINWANSFLKNARSTMKNNPSITEEEMASWESEVYAIRALYYFYLVRTFQNVPIILEAYESDTQTPYAAPSPENQVLDTIEADLTRALAHAPETFTDPQERYGRITKNAVRAIWADVKLWRGQYDACIDLCKALEAVYENHMVQGKEWFTMFSVGNSSESIFEYQYLSSKGLTSPLYKLYRSGTDNVLQANYDHLSERVLSLFPAIFDDYTFGDTIRVIEATVSPSGEVLKYVVSSPYLPLEYRGVDGRDPNFIFYRYREILLIEAEAWGMKKDYATAVECINKIRKATALPLVENVSDYGEEENFFINLLDERICEVAYEGKHWFSQVRMARNSGYKALVIERITKAAEYSVKDAKPQTMRARLQDDASWFLPYYKTEVEKNPLLNQKTYYEGK